MITIHIDPTETDPDNCGKIVDQEQNPKKRLVRNVLGIVSLLAVILFSLMTACSGTKAPAGYQYQMPADLEDGWDTDSFADAGLDSEKI